MTNFAQALARIEELIRWMEQSILQGDELGYTTQPIKEVIAKLRTAHKLVQAARDIPTHSLKKDDL